MDIKLTLLTDPVPVGSYFWTEGVKRMVRMIRDRNKPREESKYRGHPAVTRSLVEGLQKIGIPYVYNPKSLSDVTEIMVVLSSLTALKQAIDLKKQGKIRKLIAGTNITFNIKKKSVFSADEIDLFLYNSKYTCDFYLDLLPSLRGRSEIWSAGVDVDYWLPACKDSSCKKVLLFEKLITGATPDIGEYKRILIERGYEVVLIKRTKNSFYALKEYKKILRECTFMVGFSGTESQGIAWAEAWAMDVPTFIWYNSTSIFKGKTYHSSTAPYLTEQNGCFFKDIDDFKTVLDRWGNGGFNFRPRKWVLENMSDEVCVRKLLELTNGI